MSRNTASRHTARIHVGTLGLGLVLLVLVSGCGLPLFTATETISEVFETGDAPTIVVETFNGSIDISNGEADEVVPFQALALAEAGLQAADVPVHTEARPNLGHGIDEDGIALGAAMLEQLLVTDPAEAAVESTSKA